MTFIAALRHDRVEAPWRPQRADQRRGFPYLRRTPTRQNPEARRYRRSRQSRLAQRRDGAQRRQSSRSQALLPATRQPRPQSYRAALRQTKALDATAGRKVETVYNAIANVLDAVTPTECRNETSKTPDTGQPKCETLSMCDRTFDNGMEHLRLWSRDVDACACQNVRDRRSEHLKQPHRSAELVIPLCSHGGGLNLDSLRG